jgi:hypothetical protein
MTVIVVVENGNITEISITGGGLATAAAPAERLRQVK